MRRVSVLTWGLTLCLLAAAGCSDKPLAQAQPSYSASPTALDFGQVPVLNTHSLDVTFTNLGIAGGNLSNFRLSDPDGGIFTLPPVDPNVNVTGSGGTFVLPVSFTPQLKQDYEGTLLVDTDVMDTPLITISLKGSGSTVGTLVAMPSPLDFQVVGEGTVGLRQLTLTSVGTADLIIKGVSLGAGTDPSYSIASSTKTDGGVLIPIGSSIFLSVTCTPTDKTPPSPIGTIQIASTDPAAQPTLSVPLTAQVVTAPIAVIADPGTVAVGDTVTLDGGASYDPAGKIPLIYDWRLESVPDITSQASLSATDVPYPTLTADIAGSYQLSLGVTNSAGVASLQRAHAVLIARPAEDLYIEMIWDNTRVDMDLHFIAPGGTYGNAATDCNGMNQNPGFAVCGPDQLTGPGPETASVKSPVAGIYSIWADMYSPHGASDPTTNVTVRVFEYGILKSSISKVYTTENLPSQIATVSWPSGAVN